MNNDEVKNSGMATEETLGCRWDPDDPHLCFDERSCGCYMDPCDYFKVPSAECAAETSEEICCSVIDTC
ncbi:MAG: hypothetical protein VR64_20930 [Desulfatitalea sp. BRH_c12]|nr:MAG: hypothetical protein VR64_20930 [Desulfatitalea sp. BRH_c12]